MADHQDFGELFVETVGVFPQSAQELENGYLQKWVLDASDLILSMMLLRDQSISPCDLGHKFDQLRRERIINIDRILHEGHATEQHSMTLLLQTGGNLRHKFRDILRHSLHDLYRSQDSFLPDIGRVVVDTLHIPLVTLRTS